MNPITANKWRLRFSWLFLFFGVVIMGTAVVSLVKTRNFLSSAARTEGAVVQMVERHSSNSGTTYAPVYTFTDKAGKLWKIYSTTSNYPPAYTVGEQVEVLYLPNDPNHAKLDSFFDLWGSCTIASGIGLVIFLIGAFSLWWYSMRRI